MGVFAKSLILAAGVIGLSGAAMAADVAKPPPPAAAPVVVVPKNYDWNGIYLGLNGGGGWGQEDCTSCSTGANDFNLSGPFVGGQIGWNFVGGGLVWGLEADAQWSGIDGSCNGSSACNGPPQLTVQDLDWFATARGRLGFVTGTGGNMLWYVTRGWAWGHGTRNTSSGGGDIATANHNSWTAGAGLEWVVGSKATAKVEYQYLHFAAQRYVFPDIGGPDPAVSMNAHTVRFGLNWHL